MLRGEEEKMSDAGRRLAEKIEAFGLQREAVKAAYTAARAHASIAGAFAGISGEVTDADAAARRAQDQAADLEARAGGLDGLLTPGAQGRPLAWPPLLRAGSRHSGRDATPRCLFPCACDGTTRTCCARQSAGTDFARRPAGRPMADTMARPASSPGREQAGKERARPAPSGTPAASRLPGPVPAAAAAVGEDHDQKRSRNRAVPPGTMVTSVPMTLRRQGPSRCGTIVPASSP